MNHGDYSYNPETGIETYCGIKVIDNAEQIDLIEKATQISEKNLKMQLAHSENYGKYEIDGKIKSGLKTQWMKDKPAGYCRIYSNTHDKRYSVSPFVSYNCSKCLGTDLVFNRSTCLGIDVEFNFEKPTIDTSATFIDISKFDKVKFRLNRGVCELYFDQHVPKTSNFTFVCRPKQNPLLKVSICRTRNEIFYGKCIGTMIGIPICESILRCEPCKTLLSVEPIKDFSINSVPRGYPNWTELHKEYIREDKNRPIGKIWVHRKCKRCTDAEHVKPDPVHETIVENDAIKRRDQMIAALMEENKMLREQHKDLLIRLDTKS
jgi:hypothetical protein